MPKLAAVLERLSSALRSAVSPAEAVAPPARPRRARPAPRRSRPELEQLAMDLGPDRPHWTFSRLAARSPHHARIVEHLELARRFFPELAGMTIHVGLAQKRGVLGWASLDPDKPGVWVRPRRIHLFTIAHEFTHLLQAKGLVPAGERSCDLHALARTPLLIDHPPGYLKLPRELRRPRLGAEHAHLLCDTARRALAARAAGDRRYLQRFEREIAEAIARG